jgi:GMP synthase PP-ATPase subunit
MHDYVVGLRAVETIDFLTGYSAGSPYDFLELASCRKHGTVDFA